MATIQQFNILSTQQQKEELFKCCGSNFWADKLLQKIPFASVEEIKIHSDKIWFALDEKDWLEAFTHHPKIGDVKSLAQKFASTKQWASGEQAGVNEATTDVLMKLKNGNDEYEKKFGYIFIVCATGKSAAAMLQLLKQRIVNDPIDEIMVAAKEQNKITHLRLEKLFS